MSSSTSTSCSSDDHPTWSSDDHPTWSSNDHPIQLCVHEDDAGDFHEEEDEAGDSHEEEDQDPEEDGDASHAEGDYNGGEDAEGYYDGGEDADGWDDGGDDGNIESIEDAVIVNVFGEDALPTEIENTTCAWLALVPISFFSAGLIYINQPARQDGRNRHVLCLYRNLIGLVVNGVFVYWKERNSWREVNWGIVWRIMLLALLDPVINQQLVYSGVTYTSAPYSASFLASTGLLQPVATLVFSCVFRLEPFRLSTRPTQLKMLGAFIALMSGAIISLPSPMENGRAYPVRPARPVRPGGPGGPVRPIGPVDVCFTLVALCATSCYNVLLTDTISRLRRPWSISACTCALGVLFALVLSFFTSWTVFEAFFGGGSLLTYAYSGVLISGVSTYFSMLAHRLLGPVRVGAITPFSMAIVTVVDHLVRGQSSQNRLVAIILAIVGMLLILWGKNLEVARRVSPPRVS